MASLPDSVGSGWGGKRSTLDTSKSGPDRSGWGGQRGGWGGGTTEIWENYIFQVFPGYKDEKGSKFTTYNNIKYQVVARCIWNYVHIRPIESFDK